MDDIHDRALGAFLGLAVGDAVGTTLEFCSRDTQPHLEDMVGGGPFDLPAGAWTDDTAMALALADSLVESKTLDCRDLMDRFVKWWRDGDYSWSGDCFDIGNTTCHALTRYLRTGDPVAGSTESTRIGILGNAFVFLDTTASSRRALKAKTSARTNDEIMQGWCGRPEN